jgi:hypothetical protein
MREMPFLTIFTAPKPFNDPHIATIQCNAIRSWLQLGEEVEVLLIGAESGMAEAAAELGVRQLAEVRRNEWGTPLVSSIFELARRASQATLLAYLNADMLVMADFLAAARQADRQTHRFLIVGQRWDLDVRQPLEFGPGWEARLRVEVRARGRLHAPAGSDYFIFPRPLFAELPDFAIGRAGWDNWAIYHALRSGWAVIDATRSIMAVHQDHDYGHLPGGRPHYDLEESDRNQALAGGLAHLYTVLDTEQELVAGRVRRHSPSLLRAIRRAEIRLMPEGERRGLRWAVTRRLRRLRRSLSGTL